MRARGKARGARLLGAAIGVAAGALPGVALAQPPSAASTVDAALEVANQHFVHGHFAAALEVLLPACTSSNRPECAFSVGAVYHALGRCPEAREQYFRYRELAPDGPLLPAVQSALEEIEPQCGAAVSEPAPPGEAPLTSVPIVPVMASAAVAASAPLSAVPVSEPPVPSRPVAVPLTPEPPRSNTPLVVTFVGLSGAAAITSVVFGVLAARSASRCDDLPTYDRDYREECEHKFYRYRGLSYGFAAAGVGALAVGGAIWWLDVGSGSSLGVAQAKQPTLHYRARF